MAACGDPLRVAPEDFYPELPTDPPPDIDTDPDLDYQGPPNGDNGDNGYNGYNGDDPPTVSYQLSWQAALDPAQTTFNANQRIYAIDNHNEIFIAVGPSGRMARSTDNGVSWTAINAGAGGSTFTSTIRSIAFGTDGNGYRVVIAGGNNGRMARSTNDGVSWTAINAGTGSGQSGFDSGMQVRGIAYNNNGTFVAVGTAGVMAHSNNGGQTWTRAAASQWQSIFGNQNINAVAFGNGTFVAVATDGRMARSTNNGVTWTRIPAEAIPSQFRIGGQAGVREILDVTFGHDMFIASSTSLYLVYSHDNGVTWRHRHNMIGNWGTSSPAVGFLGTVGDEDSPDPVFITGGMDGRVTRQQYTNSGWVGVLNTAGNGFSQTGSTSHIWSIAVNPNNGVFIIAGDNGRMSRGVFPYLPF
jgi:photosystem II stability/assembly factor-like uncharacterized protein